jgi:poly(A) polymerase
MLLESQRFVQPKTFHASDHDIDPAQIDDHAVLILKRLRDAGFLAFLVGGSVRDLLLKKTPKDFDISTSARPEEIKAIFQRQCILIGRRFRLAHIRFGHKVFEVSTFRSGDNEGDLILHDNIWGGAEEDALRRDFTINGLFYDPVEHAVIDYVDGWADIHKHVLRTIGDPVIRFRQDPVRMIRLLKFKARFGFHIAPEVQEALDQCFCDIVKSSPARILEEILRMLESGASAPFFRLMRESGLLDMLFPNLAHFLEKPHGEDVYQLLGAADHLNAGSQRKPIDRAVLTSCLLFPILEREIDAAAKQNNLPHFGQVILLTSSLIKEVIAPSFAHFPKRISAAMNFILSTQFRMTPLSGKRHVRTKLLFNKEFELALMFLKVRSLASERFMEDYRWWKQQYLQTRHQIERQGRPPPALKDDSSHAEIRKQRELQN